MKNTIYLPDDHTQSNYCLISLVVECAKHVRFAVIFFFLTSHCKSIYKLQKLAHLFVNDLCENPKSDSLSPIKMR